MIRLTPDQLKKEMLDILIFFDGFCSKNNLKYSLWYGTAIGAIRHKGFIPWDDDVDVIMPRLDYEKLICLFKNNDKYTLAHNKTKHYKYPFAKMCSKRAICKSEATTERIGVYIDIFPLDLFEPNQKKIQEARKLSGRITLSNLKIINYSTFKNIFNTGALIDYVLFILKLEVAKFFYPYYKRKLNKLINDSSGNMYTLLCWFPTIEKEEYSTSIFDNLIRVEFENHFFYIIREYDYYLKKMYGDYLTPPPIGERQYHRGYNYYYIE